MSGPKYGQILIGKIRRMKLMKELDVALEKRECNALVNKQNALQHKFDKFFEEHPTDEIRAILENAKKVGCEKTPQYRKLMKHLLRYERLSSFVCNTEGDSKALTSERRNSVERYFEMGNIWHIMKEEFSSLEKVIENRKNAISESYVPDTTAFEATLSSEKVDELYEKIIEETVSDKNFSEIKAFAESVISSVKYDEETKERILKERLNGIALERNSSDNTEEIESLTAKYEALCEYLSRDVNSAVLGNIHALRDEVTALYAEAEQKTMGEYITDSVRDIMERIGYDIIGSNTVSTHKHTTQKDYYEFSESSVINVSSNEEGSVLFEVLGKSESGEISPAEKRAVKDDMDKFCPDYDKVKALLSEYDLSVTDERTCEADERYVRAVSEEFLSKTEKRRAKKSRRMTYDE